MGFMLYAAAMSITPGPNNAILATLGARHGWRGAAPYAMGVVLGMFGLLVAAGMGVGALIAAAPGLQRAIALAGIAYMAYLGVKLWREAPHDGTGERSRLGFWSAVTFQVLNPKALLMAFTAAGGFLSPGVGLGGSAVMAAFFVLIGGPCVTVWALAGDRLQSWLQAPGRARLFTRTMAVLVMATALSMLKDLG
jgi:threonine/homoserine/homoserine lactone efflux protein